jgi:colanic acid/amylovoran biosynthesis protein
MIKKVLILSTPDVTNRGGELLLKGLLYSIKHAIPDSQITILSTRIKRDQAALAGYDIEVCQHPWYSGGNKSETKAVTLAMVRIFVSLLLRLEDFIFRTPNSKKKVWYSKYDILVDPTIDAFNERYYGIRYSVYSLLNILLPKLIFNKPLVMAPATIGPFTRKYSYYLAKYVLKRVDFIATRGEISRQYLLKMGINDSKIFVCGDLGYLVQPSPDKIIEQILNAEGIDLANQESLIGITPNQHIFMQLASEKKNEYLWYITILAEIADYLVQKFNARVLLIPHDFKKYDEKEDDRIACLKIYDQLKNKKSVNCILSEYSADVVKGLIGRCELFIGCRMHSTIAATSMCVPTVALGFGNKFNEVIGKILNQKKYIVSLENQDFNEISANLKDRINEAWNNRKEIRQELYNKKSDIQCQALAFSVLLSKIQLTHEKVSH